MAGKHMVTCMGCGRRFDANKMGSRYFPDKKRYMCSKCYRKLKAERKELENDRINSINMAAATGDISEDQATILKHKGGKGKMIAGIIVAAVGLIGIFSAGGRGAGYLVVCILAMVVGAGLLVWHFLNEKKYRDAIAAEKNKTAANMQAEANATKICPKCGATTKGQYCEYCGAKLP